MGIEDGEQTFEGGDPVKAAAAELTEGRKLRDAAVAREAQDRPAPRQQSADEIEQAVWARDTFRNTVAAEVQADTEKEGFKFNARKAGQALALLRQHEAETAQQTEADEQADELAMQAASRIGEPPAPDVNSHPHVQATLQRLGQHEVAMENARVQYEYLANEAFKAHFASALQEFSDIQTDADVQYLRASDPARWGRFQQTYQNLLGAKNHIAAQVGQQAARQQAQFNAYAQQHDHEFTRRHPELNHPATATAVATNVVRAFQSVGISENELAHAWKNNPVLRDFRIQEMLLEVGKMYAARENVRNGGRHPVPAVQRPGVARDRHVDFSEVQQLKQKFGDGPLSLKDSAALLAATRRARAGR